ncbi:MAG: polyprenyl synthetase family protein [Planctomycetota bacterium]|nr:polyprenyl synthetase family protein [Planctomycetota bacterium]
MIESSYSDTQLRERIDAALKAYSHRVGRPRSLVEAMDYALLGPGKRIRPLISLRCALACGGSVDTALPAACAIEMVHAFSLVHDDLPALDNDDLRRGRPTLHRAFPESLAILAGDALLSQAIEVALQCPNNPAIVAAELLRGTLSMIDGQVLDTIPDSSNDPIGSEAHVQQVHELKTGALIVAAARMGALAANAHARDLEILTEWSRSIGLMFQLVDDWIDATQSASEAGKTTGKDAHAQKHTWVTVTGVDATARRVQTLALESTALLDSLGPLGESLQGMTRELASRTR